MKFLFILFFLNASLLCDHIDTIEEIITKSEKFNENYGLTLSITNNISMGTELEDGSDYSSYNYLMDWRTYLPWYIAFYRWGVFILFKVIPSLFYRQLKFKRGTPELVESGDYYDNDDVTVVMSVYNPPLRFPDTIASILANKPKKFIIVTTINSKGSDRVQQICSRFPEVTLLWEGNLGKRDKLVKGIKYTDTKLVVLVDDDISWSTNFLEKLVAPFQHSREIGGVGCRQVGRVNGFCDIWGIMADMRLAVRFLELMATTTLDKGAACLSGRTACYRTDILQKEEFYHYLLHEKFFGKQLLSGDDKCITRFVINQGFKTYHQLRKNCELATTFETGFAFFEQLKRWSRNTWRSDITALFIERKIWRVTPVTAFVLLDKMLTPFVMLYGITFLPYKLIVTKSYALLIGWFAWLLFSRFLKLIYYFWIKPQNIIFLPFFVIFQYIQAIIRIWALITINERKWGTKDMTVKGGVIINNNDILKSKNYNDIKGSDAEESNRDKNLDIVSMEVNKGLKGINNEIPIEVSKGGNKEIKEINDNMQIAILNKVNKVLEIALRAVTKDSNTNKSKEYLGKNKKINMSFTIDIPSLNDNPIGNLTLEQNRHEDND